MKILFFISLLLGSTFAYGESYKLTPSQIVVRLDDNANIPFDAGNMDYQKYQLWLRAGNSPLPADPLPPPTKSDLDILKEKIAILEKDVSDLKLKVK